MYPAVQCEGKYLEKGSEGGGASVMEEGSVMSYVVYVGREESSYGVV